MMMNKFRQTSSLLSCLIVYTSYATLLALFDPVDRNILPFIDFTSTATDPTVRVLADLAKKKGGTSPLRLTPSRLLDSFKL